MKGAVLPGVPMGPGWLRHWDYVQVSNDGANWYNGRVVAQAANGQPVVVRRDAVEQVGGFDEDPVLIATEDYDLWLRIAGVGGLGYLDAPLVDYRVTPGQLSDDERFMRGIDRIMDKMLAASGDKAVLQGQADRRRAGVRMDLAHHLARAGRGRASRGYLREARRLGAGPAGVWKTWLRSFLGAS